MTDDNANSTQMTEAQMISYLKDNPAFFEHHPNLLADIYVPSPHGKGAVSLAERQQLAQRDKIRVLEAKLAQLMSFGKQNDAIGDKVHELSVQLLKANSLMKVVEATTESLNTDFDVPLVAVRVWKSLKTRQDTKQEINLAADHAFAVWVKTLSAPYCGHRPEVSPDDLLGEGVMAKSYAVLPLKSDQTFGALIMASESANRFEPDMGVQFLERISALLGAAIEHHCSPST